MDQLEGELPISNIIVVKPTYIAERHPSYHNQAMEDFNRLVKGLSDKDIDVLAFESPPHARAATFPNNWVTSHHDSNGKTIVIYPMQNPGRRIERDPQKSPLMHFILKDKSVEQIIDLTFFEKNNKFLEGTGSLVLDRINRIAFLGVAPKNNLDAATEWAKIMNYELCHFQTIGINHLPVYHTNVMMTIGQLFAIVCFDVIPSKKDQDKIKSLLKNTGRIIIEISFKQMTNYCANCLQVTNRKNQQVLCLSKTAYDAYTNQQKTLLESFCNGGFAVIDYSTIEYLGGGSVRCSLLEY